VPVSDMMRTFNMGVGLIVVTTADKVDDVKAALGGFVIGDIVRGEQDVTYLK
jgi:phosphoribosylaminoimidazole (AIR) synthetase